VRVDDVLAGDRANVLLDHDRDDQEARSDAGKLASSASWRSRTFDAQILECDSDPTGFG